MVNKKENEKYNEKVEVQKIREKSPDKVRGEAICDNKDDESTKSNDDENVKIERKK